MSTWQWHDVLKILETHYNKQRRGTFICYMVLFSILTVILVVRLATSAKTDAPLFVFGYAIIVYFMGVKLNEYRDDVSKAYDKQHQILEYLNKNHNVQGSTLDGVDIDVIAQSILQVIQRGSKTSQHHIRVSA